MALSRFRNQAIKNLAVTQVEKLQQKEPLKAKTGGLDRHLRYKSERFVGSLAKNTPFIARNLSHRVKV